MEHQEIRKKFLDFFEIRGHTIVPASSLIPDDPSVLFTTAGMQQFKPYYTGVADAQHDFQSLNTASIQECIRTSDIDEVGDESHLTFFEMLGNFSFGGYFKKEAIQYAYDFIAKEMGLSIDYVTVFSGEAGVPEDTEAEAIWKSINPDIIIKKFGRADNFWGPTGDEGPCGPTTEIYVNGIEIWNIVFNQYYQYKDSTLKPLGTPGIDTGMGLERLAMVAQGRATIFETDLFPTHPTDQSGRIIADHTRAISALIDAGVQPSNKDRGYVLRRLIRRVVTLEYVQGHSALVLNPVFEDEKKKFLKTLASGIKELDRLLTVDAGMAFKLYESYGLPYEVIKDVAGSKADTLTREAFDEKYKEHQEKSRAGSEKKFGGHGLLLDTGELKAADAQELAKVARLHTATHVLQSALRQVLGDGVSQAGSDITAERLRFDFTFSRKMTTGEIAKVQDIVNDITTRDLPVTKETLSQEDALKTGALHFFKIKYPPRVDVYSIGDVSKEFCGGPHITHTGEMGRFTILKEEGVSAGVRRIRATVE